MAEEIARIALEDEQWYANYEKVQEEFDRFMADYEEKKAEYELRAGAVEVMPDGPVKVEA